MITIASALKTLKKYGYKSDSVHPFLYNKNNVIGVVYSYIDDCYGIIERVATFKEQSELELFLKRFQWYKLNGRLNGVHIELSNYEIANPQIIYIRKNHVMSDFEIFNIENYDKREDKCKRLSHTKRILAEAQDLMDNYYIKKDDLNRIVNNYYKKNNELKRYYNNLQLLINKYNNKNFDTEFQESNNVFNYKNSDEDNIDLIFAKARKEKLSEEQTSKLLSQVWNLNKELELNQDYLEALKCDDALDEEMRLVITKIDYVKELLNKKGNIFTRKIDLKKAFLKIDSTSTFVNVYGEDFNNKVISFVNNKYNAFDKINEFKLCEYLNDFIGKNEYDINRNIRKCSVADEEDDIEYGNDLETIKSNLTQKFNKNLSLDEQYSLILYTSLYKDIFDIIMNVNNYNELSINDLIGLLNITDGFNQIYENSCNKIKKLLMLDCNKEMRETVFKNIDFKSKELFIESIRNSIQIISNINDKIKCNDNLRLYFETKNFDDLGKDQFIFTTSSIANYIYKDNVSRLIIANLRSGVNLLFSPKYLKLPISNAFNQKIELVDEVNPQIILDCKDIIINKMDNVIILSKFDENIVTEDSYKYVDNFKLNFKVNISKIMIEKRIK